jgi:hypothetical protein
MLVLFALISIATGWAVSTPIRNSLPFEPFGRIAIYFPLGAGILTWISYLTLAVGAPLNYTTAIAVPIGTLVAVLAAFRPWQGLIIERFRYRGVSLAQLILAVGILALTVWSVQTALTSPIYWPDAIYYYDGLGRIIAGDGGYYSDMFDQQQYFHELPALNAPSLHALSYAVGWEGVATFYSAMFGAFVGLFVFLRWDHGVRYEAWASVAVGGLFGGVFAITPFIWANSVIVLTSMPAALYIFAGVIIWWRAIGTADSHLLVLAGVLLAISSWTRTESLLFYLPVIGLTLLRAVDRDPEKRINPFGLLGPLLVMELSRYLAPLVSGTVGDIPFTRYMAYRDLVLLGVLVLATFGIQHAPDSLRPQIRISMLGIAIVGAGSIIAVALLNAAGIQESAEQLWNLSTNPVWGQSWILLLFVFVSPSLFRGVNGWLALVILWMVVLRLLIYADIIGTNVSDATITHSGNRVLLNIWPLLLFWVSLSDEVKDALVEVGIAVRRRVNWILDSV